MTPSICDSQYTRHSAKRCSAIMLSVCVLFIMLNFIMLSVIMLNVVMLSAQNMGFVKTYVLPIILIKYQLKNGINVILLSSLDPKKLVILLKL